MGTVPATAVVKRQVVGDPHAYRPPVRSYASTRPSHNRFPPPFYMTLSGDWARRCMVGAVPGALSLQMNSALAN